MALEVSQKEKAPAPREGAAVGAPVQAQAAPPRDLPGSSAAVAAAPLPPAAKPDQAKPDQDGGAKHAPADAAAPPKPWASPPKDLLSKLTGSSLQVIDLQNLFASSKESYLDSALELVAARATQTLLAEMREQAMAAGTEAATKRLGKELASHKQYGVTLPSYAGSAAKTFGKEAAEAPLPAGNTAVDRFKKAQAKASVADGSDLAKHLQTSAVTKVVEEQLGGLQLDPAGAALLGDQLKGMARRNPAALAEADQLLAEKATELRACSTRADDLVQVAFKASLRQGLPDFAPPAQTPQELLLEAAAAVTEAKAIVDHAGKEVGQRLVAPGGEVIPALVRAAQTRKDHNLYKTVSASALKDASTKAGELKADDVGFRAQNRLADAAAQNKAIELFLEGSLNSSLTTMAGMFDSVLGQAGDEVKTLLELKIPVHPGVFVGFALKGRAHRKSAEDVEIGFDVAVTGGGTVGIAELKGALGGYMKAAGRTSKEALNLFSYGMYQRCQESEIVPRELIAAIWGMGGKSETKGGAWAEAELWAAATEQQSFAGDDKGKRYVESGGLASVSGKLNPTGTEIEAETEQGKVKAGMVKLGAEAEWKRGKRWSHLTITDAARQMTQARGSELRHLEQRGGVKQLGQERSLPTVRGALPKLSHDVDHLTFTVEASSETVPAGLKLQAVLDFTGGLLDGYLTGVSISAEGTVPDLGTGSAGGTVTKGVLRAVAAGVRKLDGKTRSSDAAKDAKNAKAMQDLDQLAARLEQSKADESLLQKAARMSGSYRVAARFAKSAKPGQWDAASWGGTLSFDRVHGLGAAVSVASYGVHAEVEKSSRILEAVWKDGVLAVEG